jgi:anti-sigma-K factor RskA
MTDRPEMANLEELIAGYVLGNLSSAEAETLQQLLAEHPAIADDMQQLQEVLATMPYALPEAMPSPALKSAILAVAAAPKPARWQKWSKIAAIAGSSVAALFVMTTLAVDNYHLRQRLANTETRLVDARYFLGTTQAQIDQQKELIALLQHPSTRIVSFRGMDPFSDAMGNLIFHPTQRESILVLQNLPILPPGQSYQLWSVVNQQKVASGSFNADADGQVLVKLAIDQMTRVPNLIVTVEMTPTPEKPGPMVMTSSL